MRYRLTKSDVSKLASKGYLEEEADFGNQKLYYAIQLVDDEQLSSIFHDNTILLYVPKCIISDFEETDSVSFEKRDGNMHLLVEKDFTCLDNVAEDQGDNYPNPLADKIA